MKIERVLSAARALMLVSSLMLSLLGPASAFEPVSVSSATAAVRLTVLGSYRGGMYSTRTPASPPGYDPRTHRLFLGSDDREAIDVLDISDPRNPRRILGIDLRPFGGVPDSMDVSNGIVAVTVKGPGRPERPRRLLLLDVDGST